MTGPGTPGRGVDDGGAVPAAPRPGAARRGRLPARPALLVLALALGLGAPLESRAQGTSPPPSAAAPLAVATALNAAWNAHDEAAVLALFAPDAVVRQPAEIRDSGASPVVRDVYGAPWSHEGGDDPLPALGDAVVWAGRPGIRAWAVGRFALRHRVEADAYRADGERVTWQYRAYADPYQTLPGVPPVAGAAGAIVRAGRITALDLAAAPESLRQRDAALHAFVQTWAPRGGPPAAAGGPPRGPGAPVALPAAADASWALALGGLGALTALALRRRGARR